MAKPLSPKSIVIRRMLAAHPDLSSGEIARLCNAEPERESDFIEVSSTDVTIQRNALAKRKEDTEDDEPREPLRSVAPSVPSPARSSLLDPLDVLDAIEDLKRVAQRLGGYDQVRRIIDRLSP